MHDPTCWPLTLSVFSVVSSWPQTQNVCITEWDLNSGCPRSRLRHLSHTPTNDICRDKEERGQAVFCGLGMLWGEKQVMMNNTSVLSSFLPAPPPSLPVSAGVGSVRRSDLSWNCQVRLTGKWHVDVGPSVTHKPALLLNGVDNPNKNCLHANKCRQVC